MLGLGGRSLPDLAAYFRVSGSLIRRLLVTDLGLLRLEEPQRELSSGLSSFGF